MSSGRQTLAQQLKALHENTVPTSEADPENAYSSLSAFQSGEADLGREHYAADAKSRIRDTAATTLDDLAQKYSGPTTTLKQQKIFDDDPSDGEDTTQVGQSRGEYDYFGESSGGEESFADEQEDDDEIEDQTEASGEDEGDIQEGDDSEREQDVPPVVFRPNLAAMSRTQTRIDDEPLKQTLDPMAALKTAKAKDVEKGHAIQKQQKTFDELLTARITLQKAWASGSKIPVRKRKVDILQDQDLLDKCYECVDSLGKLSDQLYQLRQVVSLKPCSKRQKIENRTYRKPEYWTESAADALRLIDDSQDYLIATLDKWSSKIQVATAQQASLGKQSTKFSAGTQMGVLEAIENGLSNKARSEDVWQDEDPAYKMLLREVIESRSGSAMAATPMQSEKKKRRDAERGASKGRKLRYTVHEKAQNFVVPVPLAGGWHEEQIDELFSSLLGGAGAAGAGADRDDGMVMGTEMGGLDSGVVSLSGLKVF